MRVALLTALVCVSVPAFAADPTYEYKDVTALPPPAPVLKWAWKANMTFGLVWVAGNAQSLGLSGTGLFSGRRGNDEFALTGGGAYVVSGVSTYGKGGPIDDSQTSAENWLIKARYDRYFFDRNTVFASFQSAGDRPAGFIYRIEPQLGYARLFLKSQRQLLRAELGYDYTFEHRVAQPMGAPRDVDYHSGRLFAYYELKFTPYAGVSEGLELLEAFNHLEGFRINSVTTLSSQIYKNIALKVNFTLHFNNDPALRPTATTINPGTGLPYEYLPDQVRFEKVDTQLDVVLAVTFL